LWSTRSDCGNSFSFNPEKYLTHKYAIYEETGVKEFWVTYPFDQMLHLYKLEERKYLRAEIYDHNDTVSTGLFPELAIDLSEVFGA